MYFLFRIELFEKNNILRLCDNLGKDIIKQ